jgi:transposase
MGEERQRYNEEFKLQTVRYIQEQTKTVADISLELNIPTGTLNGWLGKYRQFEHESIATPEKMRELERLLKEKELELAKKDLIIMDIQEELDIVKKTVHIFSKPRN